MRMKWISELSICALIFVLLTVVSCQNEGLEIEAEEEQYLNTLNEEQNFLDIKVALEGQLIQERTSLNTLRNKTFKDYTRSSDESFVFFVIGDTELNMRGNTLTQLEELIEAVNNVEDLSISFIGGDFEEEESQLITKPELLFLAGDINKDRGFGFFSETTGPTNQLFDQLDDDILFFPGNGNHDWDPYRFGDNSYGHNLGGLISNLGTASFVRRNYQSSLNRACCISDHSFNYDRNTTFFPLTTSAEFNYSFEYKGVQFTNLNTFLQRPIAMVSFESLVDKGPAWYFENKTKPWLQKICDDSRLDQRPHVLVQHYPVNSFSPDQWWNDYMGGELNTLRKEFLDIFSSAYDPVMFSGHNHYFSTTRILPHDILDHTAGYFAQQNSVIAVKASASKGVYAVAYIDIINGTVLDPYRNVHTLTIP